MVLGLSNSLGKHLESPGSCLQIREARGRPERFGFVRCAYKPNPFGVGLMQLAGEASPGESKASRCPARHRNGLFEQYTAAFSRRLHARVS